MRATRPPLLSRQCPGCGAKYRTPPNGMGQRKFCSNQCASEQRARPMSARFWAKVHKRKGDGCWEWRAALNSAGYGVMASAPGRGAKTVKAHRYSWQMHRGPIPKGMFVCHRCDNPKCVRPDHLFLGTSGDNHSDMVRKGRGVAPPRQLGSSNVNAKLTPAVVRVLRRLAADGVRVRLLADASGVSTTTIHSLLKGKTWAHVA